MTRVPRANATTMSNPNRRQTVRSRLTLILIALVVALPAVLSFLLYVSGWRPSSSGNYGELVEPARTITNLEFETLDDGKLRFNDLRKKWAFVYFVADGCGTTCEHNLYKMRQVRLTQGEDARRVQRVLVVADRGALDKLRIQLRDYPGMTVITGPPRSVRALSEELALPVGTPLDGLGRIYLLDPLGRLMMSYPANADPSGMRKDLKRLLKVSRIG